MVSTSSTTHTHSPQRKGEISFEVQSSAALLLQPAQGLAVEEPANGVLLFYCEAPRVQFVREKATESPHDCYVCQAYIAIHHSRAGQEEGRRAVATRWPRHKGYVSPPPAAAAASAGCGRGAIGTEINEEEEV